MFDKNLARYDGQNTKFDELSYNYQTKANGYLQNTNKLRWVDDAVGTTATTADIEDQSQDNYSYDAIGNLTSDNQEEIAKIEWTVSGKVRRVTRTETSTKPNLEFEYDASGQRIVKKVIRKDGSIATTYYLRDASGNVMSVYTYNSVSDDIPQLSEQYLYGSSRLGVYTPGANVLSKTRVFGSKSYELSDHLGNVRATLSDYRRLASPQIVNSATDYYPFGMVARAYNSSNQYRFGFNGKEHEDDLTGGDYDYGFRIYDSRIAKFLSVDPLGKNFPWWTPYQFAGNTPVWATDMDGLETWYTNDGRVSEFKGPLEATFIAKMGLLIEKPNTAASTASGVGGFKPLLQVPTATTVHNSSQLSSTFAKFLPTVLKHEGGFVDDPDDPGGATNKGITFNTFKANAKLLGVEATLENLKKLTNDQAGIIYQQKYWNVIKGDNIADAQVAYQYVDFYINAGNNAIKVMQKSLQDLGQDVTVDGKMGKNTLAAINNVDAEALYNKFKENRITYYENLAANKASLKKFLKGWTNRANSFVYKKK